MKHPQMPQTMIKRRTDIIQLIAQGKNNSEISRITGHSRDLIREVRKRLLDGTVFTQNDQIGRPSIQNQNLSDAIESITCSNRRMGTKAIVGILADNQNLPSPSYGTVWKIRHQLGFRYLPPVQTFFVSESQRQKRVEFCKYHLENHTDWSNVLFTDESAFYLDNDHRWVWRRKGEMNVEEIQHRTSKYTKKVMMFGGISYIWKTPLICVDGNIDSAVYCDECIDGTGMVPKMNELYGFRKWKLLQDGAPCHTSEQTMGYIRSYIDLVDNWPANSPDLNVIENLWSIIKRKVEELQPKSTNELIDAIFTVWESIPMDMIRNLIDSMEDRLKKVVHLNGLPNGY